MLGKFSGLNPKGPYQSLEKEKETFCAVFTYSLNRAREIRKSHVAVVHRRLRNVRVMHAGEVFVLLIGFFCRSRYCRRRRFLISALSSRKNGYHGSLTSHFSSLFQVLCEIKLFLFAKRARGQSTIAKEMW